MYPRPTSRTEYTDRSFLEAAIVHFTDAPCCLSTKPQGNKPIGSCIYGKTGCGVGFALTQEDADFLDDEGDFNIDSVQYNYPNLYNAYFKNCTSAVLPEIQWQHDKGRKATTPEAVAEWRTSFLTYLKSRLAALP